MDIVRHWFINFFLWLLVRLTAEDLKDFRAEVPVFGMMRMSYINHVILYFDMCVCVCVYGCICMYV